ncbi:MAG: Do family serine endopeptidase [Thermoanaerobaculia bacterium]|nr:Do family serine endopeptidase [Thermoanaerobaculia bacterium]
MHSTPVIRRFLVAVLLFTVACAPGESREAERAAQGPDAPATTADHEAATSLSRAFRSAADRADDSVVYIEVEKEAEANVPQNIPEPFRHFFGPGPQEPQPSRGVGSGFVLDDEGHIVTNHHVVSGADFVLVRTHDRREFEAEVVGSDPDTDVAVIKIDNGEDPPPPAELGSSQNTRVGDWVLALGYPLGLESTVTAGIVSAKGRQVGISGQPGRRTALESFIQTDAAINQGNSGGPLVNLQGEVVGINTLIYGGMRFVGYGFAVPIDLAQKVIGDLLEYGYVRRPKLGVSISTVTAADAEAFGLEEVAGAKVASVEEGSAADEADLETGDVIVALNGEPVRTASDLTAGLARFEPGTEVELTVVRYGERMTITPELGEFEHDGDQEAAEPEEESAVEKLGFSVQSLSPELAEQLGYEDAQGVVVSNVAPFSSAARAGVARGIKILAINRQEVRSPRDVTRIAREIEEGSLVSLKVAIPDLGENIINYYTRR